MSFCVLRATVNIHVLCNSIQNLKLHKLACIFCLTCFVKEYYEEQEHVLKHFDTLKFFSCMWCCKICSFPVWYTRNTAALSFTTWKAASTIEGEVKMRVCLRRIVLHSNNLRRYHTNYIQCNMHIELMTIRRLRNGTLVVFNLYW